MNGAAAAADQAPESPPAAPPAAPAAQSPSVWDSLEFGATLEGYYQYNWNQAPDRVLALRAYDTRANSFSIQQAALIVESPAAVPEGRRYGLRVDLQFGLATETVQGSAANEPRPDVYRHVWQAYGSYVLPVGRGLRADFGKFASNLGYETNYAKDNQAFSRAYLFNFLPFYHTGVRLTLPVHDQITLMYMLTNGIQQTEDFNDFKSSHVTAILKPAAPVTWTINYYNGREQPDGGQPMGPDGVFQVLDSYIAVNATAALTLGADVNRTTNQLTEDSRSLALHGLGAYARYQATPGTAFAVRYERLDDEGLFGGIDQVLHEATLTAERKFGDNFILRGELRRDWSNEKFFPGRLGSADAREHQNTALVGGIWVIGNKPGAW